MGWDCLQSGDHQPPGPLEQFFVRPLRELLPQPPSLDIVPTEEDQPEAEQARVLVDSRITQDWEKGKWMALNEIFTD
jgi:hypothetical protein